MDRKTAMGVLSELERIATQRGFMGTDDHMAEEIQKIRTERDHYIKALAMALKDRAELYEALREAVEHKDGDHNPGWAWRQRSAAILAKVRGEG